METENGDEDKSKVVSVDNNIFYTVFTVSSVE